MPKPKKVLTHIDVVNITREFIGNPEFYHGKTIGEIRSVLGSRRIVEDASEANVGAIKRIAKNCGLAVSNTRKRKASEAGVSFQVRDMAAVVRRVVERIAEEGLLYDKQPDDIELLRAIRCGSYAAFKRGQRDERDEE